MEQKPRDMKTTPRGQDACPRPKISLGPELCGNCPRAAYCFPLSPSECTPVSNQGRSSIVPSLGPLGLVGASGSQPKALQPQWESNARCCESPGDGAAVSERRPGVGQGAVGRAALGALTACRRQARRSVAQVGLHVGEGSYEFSRAEHRV